MIAPVVGVADPFDVCSEGRNLAGGQGAARAPDRCEALNELMPAAALEEFGCAVGEA